MLIRIRPSIFVLAVLASVSVAATSGRADPGLVDTQHHLYSHISALQGQIAEGKNRAGVLSTDIQSADAEVTALEGEILEANAALARLEGKLATQRAHLERLRERLAYQTHLLEVAKRAYAAAQKRLNERLVALYKSRDITALEVLLQAESLGSLVDQLSYRNRIGAQDKQILLAVGDTKTRVRAAKKQTASLEAEVAEETRVLAGQVAEQRAATSALVAEQQRLAAARASKRSLLNSIEQDLAADQNELEATQAESAALAGQIASAQDSAPSQGSGGSDSGSSGGSGSPSSSGLIWPVSGTLTSGFGPRWGSMHEGIDIAAPFGTPVRAAAAGRVIIAGFSGGYGNLVVIDHGSGMATAYAHLSAIYAGGGSVGQGQSIGAVGSTGHSTGNHLHFEVRINGSPVNPLGYL